MSFLEISMLTLDLLNRLFTSLSQHVGRPTSKIFFFFKRKKLNNLFNKKNEFPIL